MWNLKCEVTLVNEHSEMSIRFIAFEISESCFVFDTCVQQLSSKRIYPFEICSFGYGTNYR